MSGEPTVGTACRCDACVETYRRGIAWSFDGYCARCAERCFPPIEIDGRWSRAAISDESRREGHGRPLRPPPPQAGATTTPPETPAVPLTPEQERAQAFVRHVVAKIPDARTRKQVREAVRTANAVAPVVFDLIGAAARVVQTRRRAR